MAYLMGSATSGTIGRLGGMKAASVAMTADDLASLYNTGRSNDVGFELKPSAIQLSPGQWLESANGKHVVLPDGARQGQYKTQGQVRGSNTWTSGDTLQYIGADAAMLPDNAVLTLYARTDASADFNIGDGSDPDYYAAAVTIGTSFAPIATLEPTHDGINRKLTLTPAASYSGTVETMFKIEVAAS